MVRFAHIADVHLGGWKQQPMQDLNFEAFKKSVDICLNSNLDFILIAGDLFDSAYPSIEILKKTFAEFRRIKKAELKCFIIAGSHDYSVSGKTFLDVLEKAGFCINVNSFDSENDNSQERDDKIILNPTIYKGVAIYGYPGRKSGLEINDLRRIKINDSPGMFRILMLHTTLDKAKGSLPIDAIEADKLPKVDYYAMGHLHIDFQYENFVYPGPIFPNNFQELEDINYGGFYIVDTNKENLLERVNIKLKQVKSFEFEIKNALLATDYIISKIGNLDIKDNIILIRLKGELENSKNSDIKFSQIEDYLKKKGVYFLLKNTHNLKIKEENTNIEIEEEKTEKFEEDIINLYSKENPSEFNKKIHLLINSLSVEKQDGETTENFNVRLVEEAKKILEF
jgi:DNA repair exonuclease SbcCD nuclease subunit